MTIDEMKIRKQEIISSTNMFDILAQYGVQVKRNMCKCMFHQEKNASMKVFKDGVQCFVCGRNWNVFDVVMQLNSCDFSIAFELLGGSEKPSWKAYAIASRARKKRENAEQLKRVQEEQIKELRLYAIALRETIRNTEPYSDTWCWCQNKVVYKEYRLDQLISEVVS